MSPETRLWWSLLIAISLANLVAWALWGAWLHRRHAALRGRRRSARDDAALRQDRLVWVLAGVYAVGCAFRSALPIFDVPRLCLVDSALARVFVGRAVATLAELALVAQWTLLLGALARGVGSRAGRAVASLLLPVIVVAEVFSWSAVLRQWNLGHVVEESLWALAAAAVVACLAAILPRCRPPLRRGVGVAMVFGVGYLAFMLAVDIPMYWAREAADHAAGHALVGWNAGLAQTLARCVVSGRWEDWRSEAPWMTLYFGPAVWSSLLLVGAPALLRRGLPSRPGRPSADAAPGPARAGARWRVESRP